VRLAVILIMFGLLDTSFNVQCRCIELMEYCTISFNSKVTRHRAQNIRKFSNLSRVTEGIFESHKDAQKWVKNPIFASGAVRWSIVANFDVSGSRPCLPLLVRFSWHIAYVDSLMLSTTNNHVDHFWEILRCPATSQAIYEKKIGVTRSAAHQSSNLPVTGHSTGELNEIVQ
jgi:hypothetical protein